MGDLTVIQNACTVQLTSGKNALVDESDFDFVSSVHWYFTPSSPPTSGRGYAVRSTMCRGVRTPVRLHRILMGNPAGMEVDHKNGDSRDDRRENLRVCTVLENRRNIRKILGRSGFKGVNHVGDDSLAKPWRVSVRRKHVGYFATAEEAARAYDAKAIELFGEFAATNADIFGEWTS